MFLAFEISFALVAAVLGILSLKTLRAIKHLGVGKSYWIPTFVSSIFFLAGSVITIIHELNLLQILWTAEVVQVAQFLALCILAGGVYSYSRRVKESLSEEFAIHDEVHDERSEMAVPVDQDLETAVLVEERRMQSSQEKTEIASECQHQFGYLQTLPRDTAIPNECLGCDKIVECKHSPLNMLDSQTH